MNKVVCYDYVNGVKTPIGRVDFMENFTMQTQSPFDACRVCGVWRLTTGEFYVCKREYLGMEQVTDWAEIISEGEAKHFCIKQPEIYAKFFDDLPDLPSAPVAET
jgi:hypothetical protein